MNTRPVFHGSDIEKICEYYHLKKEDITNFGANVNPLGLSENVRTAIAGHLDLLSSYPGPGIHRPARYRLRILPYTGGIHPARQRFQRTDLPADRDTRSPPHSYTRPHLFRIFQRTFLFRKHTGILSSERRKRFPA